MRQLQCSSLQPSCCYIHIPCTPLRPGCVRWHIVFGFTDILYSNIVTYSVAARHFRISLFKGLVALILTSSFPKFFYVPLRSDPAQLVGWCACALPSFPTLGILNRSFPLWQEFISVPCDRRLILQLVCALCQEEKEYRSRHFSVKCSTGFSWRSSDTIVR